MMEITVISIQAKSRRTNSNRPADVQEKNATFSQEKHLPLQIYCKIPLL